MDKKNLLLSFILVVFSQVIAQNNIRNLQMGQMAPMNQAGGPPQGNQGNQGTSSAAVCGITSSSLNSKIYISGTNKDFQATGCPGYDWTGQTTPNKAQVQNYNWIFPLTPVISNTKIYVGIKGANGVTNPNPVMGMIGIAANGVAIYGNADANMADAYINEGHTFDPSGGHADASGTYHYHEEPAKGFVYNDTIGQHSPVFALMADGIPLFGEFGDNGVLPTNLDDCGGHTDNTYPFYHYHLPANKAFPYTISCLKGCIFNANSNTQNLQMYVTTTSTCNPSSNQYNYSSIKNLWVNSLNSPLLFKSTILLTLVFIHIVFS